MARKKSAADQQQIEQQQEDGNTHEGNVFQGKDFFQGKQYQQRGETEIIEVGQLGGKEQSPGQEK